MSTYGKKLGSGWSPATISDVWGGNLPGDYMQAGKTHIPSLAGKWAMDKGFAKAFDSPAPDMFERFLKLQKNPESLGEDVISKLSPGFIKTINQMGG